MKPVRILLSAVLATATLVATALGGVVQADLTALTTSGSALVGLATNGNLVRSTDGGANFTTTRTASSVALRNVVASGSTVLAFGDAGFISRSTNGGQTWTDLNSLEAPPVADLLDGVTSNGTIWVAVGFSGLGIGIERSGNAGASWSAASGVPAINGKLHAVCYDASTSRWTAVGTKGTFQGLILTSTDGQTWTEVDAAGADELNDVASDGAGNLLAVGTAGTLVKSSNGGATWTLDANSGAVSETLNAVVYTSAAGFTAGGQDLVQISYTVAGGAVVSQQPIPGGGDIVALAVDSGGQVAVSGGGFSSVASVTLGNLSATYDGSPKSATASTDPNGLPVALTYDGTSTAPTDAGSYTVVGTVTGGGYTGGATGTLVIAKASQSITFDPLDPATTSTPPITLSASATSGLDVTFSVQSGPASVSGTTLTITGAGTVVVRASQSGNTNYAAASTVDQSFTVTSTTATVTLGSLSATYDGSPKSATATTDPADLMVNFTYDGSATPPINAGSYEVVGTISDATYSGSATGTLVIAKAAQTIDFTGPSNQPYTSTPISLSATASSSLTVVFTVTSGPGAISGNSLTLNGAGTVTIEASQAGNSNYEAAESVSRSFTVAANFETWRLEHFSEAELADDAISGPNAVLGADGYSNLLRYALGLDPVEPVGARAPQTSANDTHWLFSYTRPAATTDLTYTVQASTDLVDWTSIVVTHEMVGSSAGEEQWQASYLRSSASRLFFRLKVSRP